MAGRAATGGRPYGIWVRGRASRPGEGLVGGGDEGGARLAPENQPVTDVHGCRSGVGAAPRGRPDAARRSRVALTLPFVVLLAACRDTAPAGPTPSAPASSVAAEVEAFPVKIAPRWAALFRVAYRGAFAEVTVRAPWQPEGEGLRYRLRPRGVPAPPAEPGLRDFEVPLRSVATTSTTELPALVRLGVAQTWVGHSEMDFVSSPALRTRITAGEVREIGSPTDLETLLALHPDALFADFLTRPELDRLALAEKAGTGILIVPGFLETSPLGRAEWLLLFSLFFGKEREAIAAFAEIEKGYLELRDQVAGVATRPRVFTGGPFQNVWHVPGGGSFAAHLLADAGADYVWKDERASGALPLDLEKVFERAEDADFWIYPSHWRSLREIAAVDARLTRFTAWQKGRVYAADLRLSASGGNDFWEEGAARPDLVLADLVAIFHPELLPRHRQIFHRRLEKEAP